MIIVSASLLLEPSCSRHSDTKEGDEMYSPLAYSHKGSILTFMFREMRQRTIWFLVHKNGAQRNSPTSFAHCRARRLYNAPGIHSGMYFTVIDWSTSLWRIWTRQCKTMNSRKGSASTTQAPGFPASETASMTFCAT